MAWFRDLPVSRRAVVLGVMAVVVMAVGAALVGARGGGTSTSSPASHPSGVPVAADGAVPPAGHGPSEVIAGVGVGFTQDEAGAVAAAVSYSTAPQSWLYLSDEDVAAGLAQGRYAHFVDRGYWIDGHAWGVFSLDRLARTPEFRQAAP